MKRQNILQLNRQINIIMLKYASNFTVIMDTDTLFLQLRIFLQQLFHQVIGILGKIQGIVYLHREGIVRWFDSKYSQCVEICNWNGDVAKEKWPLNTFSIQGLFVFKSPKITAKDMMNREICQFYLWLISSIYIEKYTTKIFIKYTNL